MPFAPEPEQVFFNILRVPRGLGGAAAIPSAVRIIFGVFLPKKSQDYAISPSQPSYP
ncbi:hypothetical protein F5Y14DRAFT_406372 [Nemania sp. NC0429]|nr:hypothetical protein F5Y14DRAFT_406372 [Nemania sp. NC0429]